MRAVPSRRRREIDGAAAASSSSASAALLALLASLLLPTTDGSSSSAAFVVPTSRRGRAGASDASRRFGVGTFFSGSPSSSVSVFATSADDDDDDEDDDDEGLVPPEVTSLEEEFADLGFGPPTPDVTASEAGAMTVKQLRQQLRLRGLKVSGKKAELVDRLVGSGGAGAPSVASTGASFAGTDDFGLGAISEDDVASVVSLEEMEDSFGRAGERLSDKEARTREPIDVTAYLDEDDKEKDFRSSDEFDSAADGEAGEDSAGDESELGESGTGGPEVWGAQARIVDDYEGRSPVVDGLSRTVVEYRGYDMGRNRTKVRAYVSASRTALRRYLSGGEMGLNATDRASSPGVRAASKVRDIQRKREEEARVQSGDFADVDWAPEGGDEAGYYDSILTRDYGDWGAISSTGAQISAQEVAGVLLLSDVYGPIDEGGEDTRALADKVAFECQPVVVMCPDLFRGDPWREDPDEPGFDLKGRSYEQWRETHSEERVNVDIRAAAATLRERYGVSSVAVFGQCFGGGRALEAAAGWVPEAASSAEGRCDAGRDEGPPPVDPAACVAWYPTRYDAQALFGPESPLCPDADGSATDDGGKSESEAEEGEVAIMAIFAGTDTIPGARRGDAEMLKYCLENDSRVKDCMVKIFPDAEHGFAHQGMAVRGEGDQVGGRDDAGKDAFLEEEFGAGMGAESGGDAEVAALLSTAFMETYARVFLPTTGVPVKDSDDAHAGEQGDDPSWSRDIDMPDLSLSTQRDIRKELEEAVANHREVKPDLSNMPDYQYFNEIEDMETLEDLPKESWEDKFREAVEDLKRVGVNPGAENVRKGADGGAERRRDDPEEYLKKMKDAYDRGELKSWLADVDMDSPMGDREVPSQNTRMAEEYGDDFTAKFMDAMKDLREKVPVNPDDDVNAALAKFKEALDKGELAKLQEVKKIRDARMKGTREDDRRRIEETSRKFKELGIDEENDSLDEKFRKLKEAFDRGEADGLAGLPLGAFRDRRNRGDEWEDDSRDGGLW